jgi:hypothetical protein
MISILSVLLALQGTWQKPCYQQVLKKEVFQENTVSLVETNFMDQSCESPRLETISEGVFSIGERVFLSPEGNEMDFHFVKVKMRPLNFEMLSWMKEQSFCGISDWELGVFQEITGRICKFPFGEIAVPKAGEQRFGIFRLEENHLFFGELDPVKNGKSPESRPNRWDEIPFKKVF